MAFPDYSREVQKQRKTIDSVKDKLRQMHITYMLLFPAKLKVIYRDKALFFTTPGEAWHWLEECPMPRPSGGALSLSGRIPSRNSNRPKPRWLKGKIKEAAQSGGHRATPYRRRRLTGSSPRASDSGSQHCTEKSRGPLQIEDSTRQRLEASTDLDVTTDSEEEHPLLQNINLLETQGETATVNNLENRSQQADTAE